MGWNRGRGTPGRQRTAGRFIWGTASSLGLLWALACVPVQSEPSGTPSPSDGLDPSIERGTSSPEAEATVARLLADGEAALRQGRPGRAFDIASDIVDDFSAANGSAGALWLRARALAESDSSSAGARDAARFLALLDRGDDRRAAVAWFVAENTLDGMLALRALGDLSSSEIEDVDGDALGLARARIGRTATDSLLVLSDELADTPVADLVRLESAVGLYFRGEVARAADVGRGLLERPLEQSDREIARSLVEGTAESVLGSGVAVGAILPNTGSPALREYAAAIQEGIQVALDSRAQEQRRPVRLELRDDGGDPSRASRAVQDLEGAGALGVIGPLLENQLEAAATARASGLALISPTSETVPTGPGVYSLGAADPGAAQALAEYAAREGLRRIAIVYPRSSIGAAEARVFQEAFQDASRSGSVDAREFTYESGVTFFREQLMGAVDFGAEAVVFPVPESDVELIAPQVSFFALDSLGVRVMGTGAWASREVLDRVDPRHLDGVIVASARDPEGESVAYRTFVQRYEQVVRKTLRSPVPAFGYDATLLLLEAIDRGARSPADLEAQLQTINNFPGATGTLSISDGRVVRLHQLYEIRGGELTYLGRTLR